MLCRRARALALLLSLAVAGCGGGGLGDQGTTFQPVFQPLGVLPGNVASEAYGVSADGNVVVGRSDDAGGTRTAFRWTATAGMQALPPLGTLPDAEAHSASADGSVVGGVAILFDTVDAFRWTAAGGTQGVPTGPLTLPPQIVSAITGDGSTFFGTAGTGFLGFEAFRYRASDGLVGLGYVYTGAGKGSGATGASLDGAVVTGASVAGASGNIVAIRWTEAGGMVALPLLTGTVACEGIAVSPEGSFITGSCFPGPGQARAVLWETGGVTPLGSLAGLPNTYAFDLSQNASLVVGYAEDSAGNNDAAFLWDRLNGMRDLRQLLVDAGLGTQLAGWRLLSANGISADGRVIVGIGRNPAGQHEAYRVLLR